MPHLSRFFLPSDSVFHTIPDKTKTHYRCTAIVSTLGDTIVIRYALSVFFTTTSRYVVLDQAHWKDVDNVSLFYLFLRYIYIDWRFLDF